MKNQKKINSEIAKGQTEIIKLLNAIEETLIDCSSDGNDWSNVGDVQRLECDLKNIMEYRK